MYKSLLILILITCAAVTCAAQSSAKTENEAGQARQEQGFSPELARIAELEEPQLRVFLRHQIVSYLLESGAKADAESVAGDALADIKTYGKNMPASFVNPLSRSFSAQLQLHASPLADKFAELGGPDKPSPRSQLEIAYRLLNTKGGANLAVGKAREVIGSGRDPSTFIVFFLRQLDLKDPAAVPPMLSEIVAVEEKRPGTLSVETLAVLKHLYLRKETTADLQNRYLTAMVSAIKRKKQWSDTREMTGGYGLLNGTLPIIEKQQPALFAAASEQAQALAVQLPASVLERMFIDERVKRSPDPFRQLLVEIEGTKDKRLKEDLMTEAAQLALERGMLGASLDLVSKIQFESEDKVSWRDQFIERIAQAAVAGNDLELARSAISHIRSPLMRSSALQKIALCQKNANSWTEARETLDEAFNCIRKADGGIDKIVALSEIAVTYGKVDAEKVPEVIRAFVSALNSLGVGAVSSARADGPAEDKAEDLMKLATGANTLFRFVAATAVNERDVLDLARSIRRQDVETAAMVGAAIGFHNKNRQAAVSRN